MPASPLTCEVGGAMTKVPLPALTVEMAALPMPLPPLMAEVMVSWAEPMVQMLRGGRVLGWFSTPPEMVVSLPSRIRMPPEARLRRTPSARLRSAPPSMVREFGARVAEKTVVGASAVKSRFLFVTSLRSAAYSEAFRGRTMFALLLTKSATPAAESTVANEKPSGWLGEPVRPMTAQGMIDLVDSPMLPTPLRGTPPERMTLLRPTSLLMPKVLSPRNRTEAPHGEAVCAGAMLSAAASKTNDILPALFFTKVMTEAPLRNSGLEMYSVTEPKSVKLPLKISSPPRKRKLLSEALPAPRRPSKEV